MKTHWKLTGLSAATGAIIIFWLLPGIHQGKEKEYVRLYEDTYEKSFPVNAGSVRIALNDSTKRKKRKVFRKETIEPRKSKKVSGKMFSRAIQFEPVIEGDSVAGKADSLPVVQ
jgi:hypothetical protein